MEAAAPYGEGAWPLRSADLPLTDPLSWGERLDGSMMRTAARPPTLAESAQVAPLEARSSDIRVAVVGCGYWGRNHVRNYAELGALAGLVDNHEENVARLVAAHGGRGMTFDEVLDDPTITAVVCATPPGRNFALGKRALAAGKHLFLEKPLTLSVAEAEELCVLAERQDRRLMVGHILLYHPAFLKLLEIVREGQLGPIQFILSNRLNFGKIAREEDALWSLAPHDLSMILALVGGDPVCVSATGSAFVNPSIADLATMQLAFPRGERAQIFVSWLHPYKEHKLVVVGTEAMAVFDDGLSWDRKLLVYPQKVAWHGDIPFAQSAEALAVAVEPREPLKEQCRHFLDCIRTGARPRTDGREGVRVLRVLEKASHSMAAAATRIAGLGAVPAKRCCA